MSVNGMCVGNTRIARARARQREAMDRLTAEIRAREEAAEMEHMETEETEASPYLTAEQIARELHRSQ